MSVLAERDGPLRVAIDARFRPKQGAGGIESVLIGLVHALGQLRDGDEEYLIVGPPDDPYWLKPYSGPNQRFFDYPAPEASPSERAGGLEIAKRAMGPLRPVASRVLRKLMTPPQQAARAWPEVPVSDGFHESLGCDVLHFPHQGFTLCALPTVYNPHDLQHVHYPQFFQPSELARRETIYGAGCRLSRTVVVASGWVKEDVERHYRLDGGKVQVIPWAAPTNAYSAPRDELVASVREQYGLSQPFAFYPAMTWEHKNHLRLLDALALLRDRDRVKVRLVCTGHRTEFWPRIEQRLRALGLEGQASFIGLVSPEALRAIYGLAQFVIIPTLFEAASGPLFEAWQEGTPVACSTVTSLPEQAGDAALLFDPLSVEAIATALARMASDGALREELRRRGARRLLDFSWELTAKAYRAVYRRAAGRPLDDEDAALLSRNWMRDSAVREAVTT
jgi:glycosyltransferase involved in cell wall biosynthesis